jgi:hypothetical protein
MNAGTTNLILKRASASRPSGAWNDDDFDVLADGGVVGRICTATKPRARPGWRRARRVGGGSKRRVSLIVAVDYPGLDAGAPKRAIVAQVLQRGACFVFNSLRGHALTMLRSLKVILNFRAHAARLTRSRRLPARPTISLISQSRDGHQACG